MLLKASYVSRFTAESVIPEFPQLKLEPTDLTQSLLDPNIHTPDSVIQTNGVPPTFYDTNDPVSSTSPSSSSLNTQSPGVAYGISMRQSAFNSRGNNAPSQMGTTHDNYPNLATNGVTSTCFNLTFQPIYPSGQVLYGDHLAMSNLDPTSQSVTEMNSVPKPFSGSGFGSSAFEQHRPLPTNRTGTRGSSDALSNLGSRLATRGAQGSNGRTHSSIHRDFGLGSVSRANRVASLCSRASYMCRKCKTHGQNIPVKRHKRACPYMHCTCMKCQLVDQGRKVVARQIALYRDQKGGPGRENGQISSGLRNERRSFSHSSWNHIGHTQTNAEFKRIRANTPKVSGTGTGPEILSTLDFDSSSLVCSAGTSSGKTAVDTNDSSDGGAGETTGVNIAGPHCRRSSSMAHTPSVEINESRSTRSNSSKQMNSRPGGESPESLNGSSTVATGLENFLSTTRTADVGSVLSSLDPVKPLFMSTGTTLSLSDPYPNYFPWSNSEWSLRTPNIGPLSTDNHGRKHVNDSTGSPTSSDWVTQTSSNTAPLNYLGSFDSQSESPPVQSTDDTNRNNPYGVAQESQLNSLLVQSELGMHPFAPVDKFRSNTVHTVSGSSPPETAGPMNGWLAGRAAGTTTERRVWRSHWYEETVEQGSYTYERSYTHPHHFHSAVSDVSHLGNCFSPDSEPGASFYCPERVSAVAAAAAAAAAMVAMTPPLGSPAARRRCAAHLHHYHHRCHAHSSGSTAANAMYDVTGSNNAMGTEFLYPGDLRTSNYNPQEQSRVEYPQINKPDTLNNDYKSPINSLSDIPNVQDRAQKSLLMHAQHWSQGELISCTDLPVSSPAPNHAFLTRELIKLPQTHVETPVSPLLTGNTSQTNRASRSVPIPPADQESETLIYADVSSVERSANSRGFFAQPQDHLQQQQQQQQQQQLQLQQNEHSRLTDTNRPPSGLDPDLAYWRMWKSWTGTDNIGSVALACDQLGKPVLTENNSQKNPTDENNLSLTRDAERNIMLDTHSQMPRPLSRHHGHITPKPACDSTRAHTRSPNRPYSRSG
ncbi:unnamed protein product [Echinostoma caproni]|uniref:DM domain-containing protein n=1 Tax=Echinostoma caproni TaxID=27848 RepID=A0A183A6C9_9TREM|nr:unnamed protein product [Echinostoma caproni]